MNVQVVAPRAAWSEICSDELTAIRAAIAPARVFMDHVGSTAVPGLDSKPVIDLLVTVVDWDSVDHLRAPLTSLGYTWVETHNSPPRQFFKRSVADSEAIDAIHLHLTPLDSKWGKDMLVFRDELVSDNELVKKYSDLKHELAAKHSATPDLYTSGKDEFVRRVLARAAGAFSNDRLLTHQRAELNRAQLYQNWTVLCQLAVSIVTALSVYTNDNLVQLNLAIAGFLAVGVWFSVARRQRNFRSSGDQARRIVLLSSGLGEKFSPEQRMRIFAGFTTPITGMQLAREDAYFASRQLPGYPRLAELIEESAFWTKDLQEASSKVLKWILIFVGLLIGGSLWTGVIAFSTDDSLTLARILVTALVFILTADILGAFLAHRDAAQTIQGILQRIEITSARGYPPADVLLLMSDYNAAVESAPIALPGVFEFRKRILTQRWRTYLENRRL